MIISIFSEYGNTWTCVQRITLYCNSPCIAAFIGEEMIQYFVLVEQCVLSQVPSLQYALFITFSAYYVFHLEYPKPVKNAMFFFVLAYPDSQCRPATYLATAYDIKKLSMICYNHTFLYLKYWLDCLFELQFWVCSYCCISIFFCNINWGVM